MMGGFGADWDLAEAIALVRNADEIGWCRPFMGHNLAVVAGGKHYNFQASKEQDR
jgi:hypothetical protein